MALGAKLQVERVHLVVGGFQFMNGACAAARLQGGLDIDARSPDGHGCHYHHDDGQRHIRLPVVEQQIQHKYDQRRDLNGVDHNGVCTCLVDVRVAG